MILLTGATGFIGRRLVRLLVEQYGAGEILCLGWSRVETAAERSGRAVLDELGVRCVPVDLVTGSGLDRAPRSPDLVFHLASDIDTGHRDHRIDDVGTRNLLEAIGPLGSGSRFVYASSIAVADHRRDLDEPAGVGNGPLGPYNEYGRHKLLAERCLQENRAAQGFGLVIVRIPAVYGHGTRPGGVFARVVDMVRRDSVLAAFDYPGKMSLIHVEDMACLLVELSTCALEPGRDLVFMPAAEVLTLGEIIAVVRAGMGKPDRQVRLPAAFWRLTRAVASRLMALEPLVPHSAGNKLWQLALTVTDALHGSMDETRERFPHRRFRRFADSVSEFEP